MTADLASIYDRLYSYCEREGFAGYDPFDGLNSRLFRATPFKYSWIARLGFTQVVKRSPVAVRGFLAIERGVNSKGLALFALGELSRFRSRGDRRHADNTRMLLDRLLGHKIEGATPDRKPTLAFGYNFDWQSRVFYAPRGTPAIVPTAFAQQAFVETFEVLADQAYLNAARLIARFVEIGLNRPVDNGDEVCFSYTPGDHSIVYNASLLGAECLARIAAIDGDDKYLDLATRAARFVIRRQRADGAWAYGGAQKQNWVDNFHTAYVLVSLHRIRAVAPVLLQELEAALQSGMRYWLDNFFLGDGTAKYYDRETYPIDVHSSSVAIAALCELRDLDERAMPMAKKVAGWTISHLLDPRGYFYYQKRRNRTIKTPFMRWGQAWMAHALARLIETETNGN